MRYRRYYLVLVGLFIALLLAASCSNSPYKTFTLRRGVGHFSLEYPVSYDIGKVEVRSDLGYTDMTLLRRSIEGQEEDFSMITVAVNTIDEYETNIPIAVEHYLAQVGKWPDFRLLSPPSTVVVTTDNISAQQFTFSNSRATRPQPLTIITEVRWVVLFERDGLIWEMTHQSDAATAEADKADFEHLLQTFKILR